MKSLWMLLCALLVLSGCEQVRVTALPAGKTLDCFEELPGWWRVHTDRADGEDDDEPVYLHVSADCQQWFTLEQKDKDEFEVDAIHEQMAFAFREVDDKRVLGASDRPDADAEPSTENDIGDGFALLRVVTRPDRIDLFEADPRREAHRIADGQVRGRVESGGYGCEEGRCSVNVTIEGDPAAVASWLTRFDPLDRALFELRAVDAATAKRLAALLPATVVPAGKPKPHE